MTIMRTLRYGLITTALTYNQCDSLTKQLAQGVLPKLGIICTANTQLVTTPTAMRDVGLIHLYILQLIVLCNHSGEDTETRMLLRNGLEAITLQVGLGGSPFNLNPEIIPWIEHSWWTHTLAAAHQYNICINGHANELKKWTKNDSFLMDDFSKKYDPGKYGKFLQSINRVRLFLQIAT